MLINAKENNKEIENKKISQVKWTHVVLCVMTVLISRNNVFGGFYTIGICYVSALFFDKELRKWGPLFGLLGLISTGIWNPGLIKYILVMLVMMIFRMYVVWKQKNITLKHQIMITGYAFLIVNIIITIVNEWSGFTLFVGALETFVSMGLVTIFTYSAEVIYKKRNTPLTTKDHISMAFFIACLLGGFIDFYIRVPFFKSIYFRDVMIFIVLIMVTYLGGTNRGVSMSLIISTVLVIIGYMPSHFVAIYALAALIGSVFSALDKIGVILATGVGLLVGFTLLNDKVVDMPIMGAYCIAAIISLFLPRLYFGMASWFEYGLVENDEKHLLRVQRIITEKLQHFSKAFYSVSNTFEKIAQRKISLEDKDINYIIEDTAESMCSKCSMKEFCWKDYLEKTYKSAYKMLDLIEQKGQLKLGDIPEEFKKGCINPESFACTLGFKLDLFKQNLMWKNRIAESRNLVGQQFKGIAESIGALCKELEEELYFNKEDEELIRESLQAGGIHTKDIMVLENRGRKDSLHIYIPYSKNESSIEERIRTIISNVLDLQIELERKENNEQEKYCYFKYRISKVYKILAGAAFKAKGEISGDVYSFMELDEGQYLLALADGMGSGKEAMEESTATMELLENFMDSGFKNDLAVKLINSVLVLKSDIENFSTMDIILIDEYTGVAEFLKMGAATSFVLRNNEVITIKSQTLPVGILKDIDMEIYRKQLKDGDVIVMVTDGLLEGSEDLLGKEETFKQFILEAKTYNPSYMAEYLMQKSSDLLGNAEKDDMTIIVARVWK